jgi:hypothetical protein
MTIKQFLRVVTLNETDEARKVILTVVYGMGLDEADVQAMQLPLLLDLYATVAAEIDEASQAPLMTDQRVEFGEIMADVTRMTAGQWADIQGAMANKDLVEANLNTLALLVDDGKPYDGSTRLALRDRTDALPAAVGVAALSFFDRRMLLSKATIQLSSMIPQAIGAE